MSPYLLFVVLSHSVNSRLDPIGDNKCVFSYIIAIMCWSHDPYFDHVTDSDIISHYAISPSISTDTES